MKYKKVLNNENVIEIGGKVVLSFDPRYKEYLKWRDENPDLELKLINELELEIENKRLYNNGAPHKEDNVWKWYNEDGNMVLGSAMHDEYNEEVNEYYQNGNIKSKQNFLNGVLDGKYKYYYETGNLRQSGCIKHKQKDGEIKTYLENGNLILIEKFKNGKKHGKVKSYHQYKDLSGRNNRIETWKNGKLHGEWIDYHLNNKERAKGNMLYGMMDGKWTFWYHNEQIELECDFDFGNPVGSAKIYHDNGVLKEEVSF